MGLSHQTYKQPEGGPLTRKRLRTLRHILDGLSRHMHISDTDRRRAARHPRYPREGRLYV